MISKRSPPAACAIPPALRTILTTALPALLLASSLFLGLYLVVTVALLSPAATPYVALHRSLGYLLIILGYLLVPGLAGLVVRRRKAEAAEQALVRAAELVHSAPLPYASTARRMPWACVLPGARILKDVDHVAPCCQWEGEDEQCAVCLMEVEEGQQARQLGCRHAFHAGCAEQWLVDMRKNSCPMCLRKVVERRDANMRVVSR